MKKGYYIFPCGYESSTKIYSGVLKKIQMQCKEFSKYYNVEYIPLYVKESRGITRKITRRMPWTSAERDYAEVLGRLDSPDFIYIRRTTADKAFVRFLRDIKCKYPECKVIIELYTYPYEKDEYHRWIDKFNLLKDRHYRKGLKKYVDRIVTYSNHNQIWGIETIILMNGIDVQALPVIKSHMNDCKTYNLIFVGYMQRQHGLERVIEGLKEFYSDTKDEKKVILHAVGEGPELPYYQKLVADNDLSDFVLFYGSQYGAELDGIYDLCEIGISALGMYKNKLNWSSALKSREYLAKGIPVINGNPTDVFVKYECDFHLDFSNDATPIDIKRTVEWYDSLLKKYSDKVGLSDAVREYALKHVDNSVTLKPVVEYIGS